MFPDEGEQTVVHGATGRVQYEPAFVGPDLDTRRAQP